MNVCDGLLQEVEIVRGLVELCLEYWDSVSIELYQRNFQVPNDLQNPITRNRPIPSHPFLIYLKYIIPIHANNRLQPVHMLPHHLTLQRPVLIGGFQDLQPRREIFWKLLLYWWSVFIGKVDGGLF
jgi:hypothetical protein